MKKTNYILILSIFTLYMWNTVNLKADEWKLDSQIKEDYEIAAECKILFPNLVWDYFNRSDCFEKKKIKIRDAQIKAHQIELKKLREDQARGCIAEDLPNLESNIIEIKKSLRKVYDLKQEDLTVKKAYEAISGINTAYQVSTVIPDDNFQEKVLVFSIKTKCESDFNFLINLRFNQSGLVRWLRVWSQERPRGSSNSAMDTKDRLLGDEYEAERNEIEQAKLAADAAKVQKLIDEENLKQERHQKILTNLARPGTAGYIKASNTPCYVWNPNPIANETVTWSGQCKDELADGTGELIWWFEGKWQSLKGTFSFGKIQNGPIEERLSYVSYISYGSVIDGRFEGKVISKNVDGTVIFDGNYINGKKSGFGIFYWDADTRYEGYWNNDLANGKGLLIFSNKKKREVYSSDGCLWDSILHEQLIAFIGKTENQCIIEK